MSIIEPNHVYNMDVLAGIKHLSDNSVGVIIADAPYCVGMSNNGIETDFINYAALAPFYGELSREMKRVLASDGEYYWFCDFRSYAFYYPILQSFIGVKNCIVWDKGSAAGNHYSFNHELIVFGAKGKVNKGGSSIWKEKSFANGARATDGEKVYNTQKTKAIINRILNEAKSTTPLVLDLFSGSGTTTICARERGLDVIAFELNPKNFEISKTRCEKELQIQSYSVA